MFLMFQKIDIFKKRVFEIFDHLWVKIINSFSWLSCFLDFYNFWKSDIFDDFENLVQTVPEMMTVPKVTFLKLPSEFQKFAL